MAGGSLCVDPTIPVMPAIAEAFDVTTSQVQLTASFTIVGLGLGQLVVGPLSDVLGRKRTFFVGYVVLVLASVLAAFAPTFEVLLLARLLQGVSASSGIVVGRAVISDALVGRDAARGFGLAQGLLGVSPVLLPILSAVLYDLGGWRASLLAIAGVSLAVAICVARMMPETLAVAKRTPAGVREVLGSYGVALRNRTLWVMGSVVFLSQAVVLTYAGTSSLVMTNIFALTPMQFSVAFTISAFGMVTAGLVFARIGARFDPARVLWWMQGSLLALHSVFFSLVVTGNVTLVVMVAWATIMMGLQAILLATGINLALREFSRGIGAAAALLGTLQYGVGAAILPLGGSMGDASLLPLAIIAVVLVLVGVIVRLLATQRAKPGGQPAG